MRRAHDPVPESPFLTITEVAAMLKMSKKTVIKHLEMGLLPGKAYGTGSKKIWRCRKDQILSLGSER